MRNEYCGNINSLHINKKVKLCGWVDNIRNLGKIIFIDLRDREGIVQIVFFSKDKKLFQTASCIRHEFCIQITGNVQLRKKINKDKKNGNVEVLVSKLLIINYSDPLPLDFKKINSEEMRLKYRYLDLRSPLMINNLKIRSRIVNSIHFFMEKNKFLNIETPILTHSTPEGARDYLIPSRIHKNKFYALPQSPQMFKQLLMISGVDKYYQIVKCFRDEDLRSDRQPEFTQVDIEASFISAKKIRNFTEKLIKKLWWEIIGIKLNKFPIISFKKSIKIYGSDKPDLRNPLKLKDITNLVNISNKKNRAIAIKIPYINSFNEELINSYYEFAENIKIFNFFIFKVGGDYNFQKCKLVNNFNKIKIKDIVNVVNAKYNDIIILGEGNKKSIYYLFGNLKTKIANELNLINKNQFTPLWVIDFPMFEMNKKQKILQSVHHPFTAPKNLKIKKLKKCPEKIISDAYDLVMNGYEIGGGSVRINSLKIQKEVFEILGINKKEQNQKFGFFLEALKYGTPVHAGLALGLDRIIMLLLKNDNIKDIIAFPKTNTASCLMTNAPNKISEKILKDLNIQNII